VKANYKIADEQPEMLKLIFEVPNLRSQMVLLWHVQPTNSDEDWVQIESVIGEFGRIDVARAVREVGDVVCGGIASVADLVTYRHSVPLLNLNINEFERPLMIVTNIADKLEQGLTGRDEY
jgi:hypothetical protein